MRTDQGRGMLNFVVHAHGVAIEAAGDMDSDTMSVEIHREPGRGSMLDELNLIVGWIIGDLLDI